MKFATTLILFCLLLCLATSFDQDEGTLRREKLLERSKKHSDRIIPFSKQDFQEYVMQYPRPYDVVIYFTAKACRLCNELEPEWTYLVNLYESQGLIDTTNNPTFFAVMTYSTEIQYIFEEFGFKSAPNLVVCKPHMAVISEMERKNYLQGFKWQISYSDGHVTTHKMLDFVNKRTARDVFYKPTIWTMFKMFFGFIGVALVGVFAYTRLKFLWNHWVFWLAGSLIIYITCCSGIIYNILHDVPFTGREKTGETKIFADGNREQYGLEGWIVSISITMVGLFFISIVLAGEKLSAKFSTVAGLLALVIIYFVVGQLEEVYKAKSWYGPSFMPPGGYLKGPLSVDQGNNI